MQKNFEIVDKLLLLDIETTGVDKNLDSIIEIYAGTLFVDNDAIIKIALEYNKVCTIDERSFYRMYQEPIVAEMHAKSGLIRDSSNSKFSEHEMLSDFFEWTKSIFGKDIILVGNSVHFDKEFLEKKYRSFSGIFSHKILDVSSVEKFMNFYNLAPRDNSKSHRAFDDCKDCLLSLNIMIDSIENLVKSGVKQ
jgi:oligoribonuclease